MAEDQHSHVPGSSPRLHHTTFTTLQLEEMVLWYEKVAGLKAVFRGDLGAWLTNDEANHRIALLALPNLKRPVDKPHTTGHHHTAFEYPDFDQWVNSYVRLRDANIKPFMCVDHGMTISLYYTDPDGNGVEIQVDTFGQWDKSKTWMSNSEEFAVDQVGEFFDPEHVVKARSEGLTFAEIHLRVRNGEYRPEVIPDVYLPEVY
ncbi:Glyoxalase/Bleomycin resistance protein/Dioxygenase superfamily protein [Arthrobacter sp. 9V]|uniref:VOC family protein n=1 Tax=Arthrobacter sp. 9V TaxID=2653132 RepID=UPI0012F045F5|nr:VOC family protein [Arthrobacter sp. 9V]VXC43843.1 Glyoxalase/Bleomycin resistance protein/Dioxygenase superfamily protein [Arthrobacter sp. 9V]